MNNLLKRVLAGVIGIPLIIFVCYAGGIFFLLFSIIVSSLALWELLSLFEKKGYYPFKIAGILSSILIIILYYSEVEEFLYVYILSFIFMLAEIFRGEKRNPLNPIITVVGFLYITIPFALLGDLLKMSGFNLVIFIFILIWTCDTAAYFGGRIFGKHPLSSISPKKTWEGFVAGLTLTVTVSIIIHILFPKSLSLNDAIIVGAMVGVFSQAGDLFESLIKRYCNAKDSSNIIPGHGGILDRFDSLIFVAPLIFIYFKFF